MPEPTPGPYRLYEWGSKAFPRHELHNINGKPVVDLDWTWTSYPDPETREATWRLLESSWEQYDLLQRIVQRYDMIQNDDMENGLTMTNLIEIARVLTERIRSSDDPAAGRGAGEG